MKTTAQTLIIIAMVTLFSLSLNAQNTKSVKHFRFTEFVSEKLTNVKNELSAQLINLETLVKFSPVEIDETNYNAEPSVELTSIKDQLESSLKFKPSEILDPIYEYSNSSEELNNIKIELESVVKYRPSESVINKSENSEMNEILQELSKDVKYYPASAI